MANGFNPNGAILYQGPSLIDGAPIVVIATGLTRQSANSKTGAQIQTFILRADVAPLAALASGADSSICGDCSHRPILASATGASACYVNVGRSVSAVFACFARGGYRAVTPREASALFAGRHVRLGAYGDPAAAPFALWARAVSGAASVTGYTHQWARGIDARFASLCMASADSESEGNAARAAGWRAFRVAAPGAVATPKIEVACPAAKESGARTSCIACKACGGTGAKAKASILIWDHSTRGAADARRLARAA